MPTDHHLIRMAGRIHRQLSLAAPGACSKWESEVHNLLGRLRSMERHWHHLSVARSRGWHAAAAEKEQDLQAEVIGIELISFHLFRRPRQLPASPQAPMLRTIVDELRQLREEFEDVQIDLKEGLIGVSTDHIVLEGIDLGPFSIELHVSRLADRLDGGCFNCVALEPNPAASNEATTHPHVQDGHLCAGEAALPIQAALKDGRIADAFVLIRSVLQSYNSDSPYIALENWSGTRCEDCDYLADSERMYFCNGCERDVCEECHSYCEICNEGCCRSCLETDTVSGNRCCAACRRICSLCERTVDEESFDEATELCPGCLEQHQSNKQPENEHGPDTIPTTNATAATSPTPAPAAA